jgi:hypothetical protein
MRDAFNFAILRPGAFDYIIAVVAVYLLYPSLVLNVSRNSCQP